MKLGKLPPKHDDRTLMLVNYLRAPLLPTPTRIFGYGGLYVDWGVLGNNDWGDCIYAGAAHETMLWNKLRGGVDIQMSTEKVLEDYGAVTGFDPSDPSSDQGGYMLDALRYRRSTGIQDAGGKRHKIAAYIEL